MESRNKIMEDIMPSPEIGTNKTFAPALSLFVAGTVIGALAALLLAPKSGAQTRQELGTLAVGIARKAATTTRTITRFMTGTPT
jgi:hypothetical protein